MPGLILYSVNPWASYHICTNYLEGVHRVWCSDVFDSTKADPSSKSALVPPSSNPAELYRRLFRDVRQKDRHSSKIAGYRQTWIATAVQLESIGVITEDQQKEI